MEMDAPEIGIGAESVTESVTETEIVVETETVETVETTVIVEIGDGGVTGATHAIDVAGGIDPDLDQGGEGDSGNSVCFDLEARIHGADTTRCILLDLVMHSSLLEKCIIKI
mmetsp:Transcript_29965/g.41756  ORF Transcript_29965/g.41756 Transcript_29965/m.41756 type:complete len:112 (-) Transcript_29965:150-485(-)